MPNGQIKGKRCEEKRTPPEDAVRYGSTGEGGGVTFCCLLGTAMNASPIFRRERSGKIRPLPPIAHNGQRKGRIALDTVVWGEGGNTMIFVARKKRKLFIFVARRVVQLSCHPSQHPTVQRKKRECR